MSQVARVHFPSVEVQQKKFGDAKWEVQVGYLKISEHVTHEIVVRVPDSGPYPVGTYVVGAESFRTDDYGRLQVSRKGIVLVPEKAPEKAASK